MADEMARFERIVRLAYRFSERAPGEPTQLHPFDLRDIHSSLPSKARRLFDDGHYPQATFEAFKFLDKLVQKYANLHESGYKLMMAAFDKNKALVKLTGLKTVSELDEQEGFRFIFAGGMQGIRNPRGHEVSLKDDVGTCLDHLSFVSMLVRRLEAAGYSTPP